MDPLATKPREPWRTTFATNSHAGRSQALNANEINVKHSQVAIC